MKRPTMYDLEVLNLGKAECLANLRAVINDPYFAQYLFRSGNFNFESLDVKINCYSADSMPKTVKDLSAVIRELIGSETDFKDGKLVIRPSDEMKKRLGIDIAREEYPEMDLDIWAKPQHDNNFYFKVLNLGLKKSYYESQNQMGIYRKDRAALLKWYSELDVRLKEVLPHQ